MLRRCGCDSSPQILEGVHTSYYARLNFNATNNIAKYGALLLGLRKALAFKRLVVKSDSQLITCHIDKSYQVRDLDLVKYLALVRAMEKYFVSVVVRSIPRSDNVEADVIAKAASTQLEVPIDTFYEIITEPHWPLLAPNDRIQFIVVVVDYFSKWIEAEGKG